MRLNFSNLNNKIEAYQKAFVSDLRLGHSDRTPDGVRSSICICCDTSEVMELGQHGGVHQPESRLVSS